LIADNITSANCRYMALTRPMFVGLARDRSHPGFTDILYSPGLANRDEHMRLGRAFPGGLPQRSTADSVALVACAIERID
jgi:hypothetical protein